MSKVWRHGEGKGRERTVGQGGDLADQRNTPPTAKVLPLFQAGLTCEGIDRGPVFGLV